jgi:hypothetical protein
VEHHPILENSWYNLACEEEQPELELLWEKQHEIELLWGSSLS